MKLKWLSFALVLLWGPSLLSGCITNPDLEDVPHIFSEELKPAKLEAKVKLELGPGFLSLAKLGVNLTDSEAKRYLADIRKVELGVYEISGLPPLKGMSLWEEIPRKMAQRGWETLIKAKEQDEVSLIFYRLKKRGKGLIYLIDLNQTELVLVKVEGKLERLIEKALWEN